MGIKVGGNEASLFILPTGVMRKDVQPEKAGEHSGRPKDAISEPSLDNGHSSHVAILQTDLKISEVQKKVPENVHLRKEVLPEESQLQKTEVMMNHSNAFWRPVWDEAPTQAQNAKPSVFGRKSQVMAGLVFIISLNVGLLGAGIMAYIMVKKRDAKTPAVRSLRADSSAGAEATVKADTDNDGAVSDADSSFTNSSIGPSLSAFTGAGGCVAGPAPPLDSENCPACRAEYAPAAANCRMCGMPRKEEIQIK